MVPVSCAEAEAVADAINATTAPNNSTPLKNLECTIVLLLDVLMKFK
jgi:hypothetical protein